MALALIIGSKLGLLSQVKTPPPLIWSLFCLLWQIYFLRWNELISWEDFLQCLLTERPRGSEVLLYCSRTRSSCLGFGPRNAGSKLDLFSSVRSEEIYLETCQGITWCCLHVCSSEKVFFIVVHTPAKASLLVKGSSALLSLAFKYCSVVIHLKAPEDKINWLMKKIMFEAHY